jgi:dimethylaniline monooxygenase (N-oxide forming)
LGEGPPPQFSSEERFKKVNQWYSSISEQNLVSDKLKIEDFSNPPFIAISDTYLDQVEAGQIELKKATVDVIEGSSVRFSDESEGSFDAIIFATGYETDLSYLDPKVLEDVHYQSENRFKPLILNECTFGEDPSLAWVGMERGPYLGIQELQARLVAQVFKGTLPFYSPSEIQIGLDLQLAIRDQTPQPQFPQNYIRLAEILGERLGVKPDYEKIKNENPHLHELLIEGLYTCARFRLTGPKAKTALESIRNANLR